MITEEEARIIAQAVATADDYCHVCAGGIAVELIKTLPGPDWAELVSKAHSGKDNHWLAEQIREMAKE